MAGVAAGVCGDLVLCCVRGIVCCVCGIEGGASSHSCCCRDGTTPIHWVAEEGDLYCLELLLTCNADVNFQDK